MLLLIDLDSFKPINDSHGHAVGDDVLCEEICRLNDLTQGVDIVVRIGGDDFVLLIESETTHESLADFAPCVMDAVEAPYLISDMQLRISASVGVAQCPPTVANAVELLRQVDTAT